MSYSNFTLESVVTKFELEKIESIGLFSEIEPITPSDYLTTGLAKKVPLAAAIGTEKARSELIVADILVELCEKFDYRISFFSGIDFNVDFENDLTGVCDFLISLSPGQLFLEEPVIALVEAKNTDMKLGLGQCVAEMIAAQRFNQEKGNDIPCVYGATTTGVDWQFLKLEEKNLQIDIAIYPIQQSDKILGILSGMVNQSA
ncbi:hypothetical protein F4054_10675 [Candidatus Poribacteria bacterium]|nr:hypothetical protein [Candidatus Poribacteria bacterium]MYG05191.1 hypothetical protein [Candidatus Poribacteria bacterium]MYK22710.1 hypothetical protein [Candidatus Poribacteria bacterium]